MDKRTRVLNAMRLQPVDRVPVSFYTHFLSPEKAADNAVPAVLDWFRRSGMDFLCVETDGYMEYPLPCQTGRVQDWKGLRVPGREDRYFTGQLDRARRIVDGADGACVFFMLFTPFSTIKHTIGGEWKVMEYLREDPDTVREAMKVIEEATRILAERLWAETGITGFFVSLQNAETDRFTHGEYVRELRSWDLHLMEYVRSLSEYNITHMCSWTGTPNDLSLWEDYPYQTVNWSVNVEKDMDLRQARRFFRGGTALMGGFDNTPEGVLYTGSEEEIKAFTMRQLDIGGQRGTLLSADCSVQMDQDPQRIRWVVEACGEYASRHAAERM